MTCFSWPETAAGLRVHRGWKVYKVIGIIKFRREGYKIRQNKSEINILFRRKPIFCSLQQMSCFSPAALNVKLVKVWAVGTVSSRNY